MIIVSEAPQLVYWTSGLESGCIMAKKKTSAKFKEECSHLPFIGLT
jgi:hypothetical protein